MSSRVTGQSLKTSAQIIGLVMGVASLAGCSTLGSGSGGFMSSSDPTITGSTGTNGAGNLQQAMPSTLNQNGSGPYLPPANIGSRAPVQTAALPPANSTSVNSQALPDLPGSTSVGSPQTMQAQPNVTPLFADNSVPQSTPEPSAPTPSAPNLAVVPEGAFQHTIEPGESLYAIARRYDVTTDAVVRANSMDAPDQIFVGQKILIPGRADLLAAQGGQSDTTTTGSVSPSAAPTPAQAPAASPAPAETRTASVDASAVSSAGNFRWPVQGRVIVDFAASRDTGINIEAPDGAAVRAAENGTVIYVGSDVPGYGNLVLVRHSNGYVSAYAHLKDITVAKDDVLERGDGLGTVGMTGSVGRPQLHFELRQGASPVDPMPMLAG